ncbi:hypothetical protein COZ73_00920 [Candidatus Falkowbacteria bacterium CG_4_8_14_3_um_filter_36_11]|uniref:Histidine phosphatase family protein n=1 Tax=Candidatus Falkowbacteria bacterium CG02_land_8_20_14_3_00_36_14 TaxID=1974560 RepID=A0A2M7DQH1_9BACT|nr:MAG: hypothetical protein COS18_00860 [Candidatus Falkowbacteria bacterium CG02_land_8_20_14_3_00_36_14]PIX12116.1 MAG: hypothetical protein COZ73_00920 [Candidatus Falkowbacteria bacterium CG_4_8_14_3_um_filter_36_11]
MQKDYSLFFIRHGKLLLPYKSHNKMPFQILADLAIEKLNPPIDKIYTIKLIKKISKIIPFDKLDIIYTSSSKRCLETSKLIKQFIHQKLKKEIDIKIIYELKEIYFNLDKIYPKNKNFNPKYLNNNVLKAMAKIDDKTCEPVNTVSYNRINKIFKKILKIRNKKILFVTHDFIMRVIEIYIKNKGGKRIITYKGLKKTDRNKYLCGFMTDGKLSKFAKLKTRATINKIISK